MLPGLVLGSDIHCTYIHGTLHGYELEELLEHRFVLCVFMWSVVSSNPHTHDILALVFSLYLLSITVASN